MGPLWGEIFFEFFFLKRHTVVYFIFLSNGVALQTLQGPG